MSFYRFAWWTGQNVSHHSLKMISSTAALKSYYGALRCWKIWKMEKSSQDSLQIFDPLCSTEESFILLIKARPSGLHSVFSVNWKRCLLRQDGINRLILISGRTLELEKYEHQIFGSKHKEADLLHRRKNQGKQHSKNKGL